MIVVASVGGRGGIRAAMEALRRGGSALDAVAAGIEAAERGDRLTDRWPVVATVHGALALPPELTGAQPDGWDRWRRWLTEELCLEANALARMEWLVGLAAMAAGTGKPANTISMVARDGARDIVCGVSARNGAGASRRVVLALRSELFLGDALREALASLEALGAPLFERVNLHALARERIPLGASHRRGETFLYLRAGMEDYVERACLYVP